MKRLRSREVDLVDAKLLRLLERNSRTPTAELARALGMSPPSVAERLRRLEESRVIRRFTVDVDPTALGFSLAAIIRIRASTGLLPRVIELVAEIKEIVSCDRITGDDCLLARAHVRSVEDLERLIDRITPFGQTNTSIVQSSPVERRLPAVSEDTPVRRAGRSRPDPRPQGRSG